MRCSECFLGCLTSEPNTFSGEEIEASQDEYRIRVDGFARSRLGPHILYSFTVSRGDARWPLRCRFRQVVALHREIYESFGQSGERRAMPGLPPKVTCRSLCFGPHDGKFLRTRALQMQEYLQNLLRFIPHVDQSEVLREFLCSVDMSCMHYDALLGLGEALGDAGAPRGLDSESIEALSKRVVNEGCEVEDACPDSGPVLFGNCVVCQEEMSTKDDVRTLPCGHDYHFACISRWLMLSNSCCVCQAPAATRTRSSGEHRPDVVETQRSPNGM